MYKYEYCIISVSLQYLFTKNTSVHEYNTRNRRNFVLPYQNMYTEIKTSDLSLYMSGIIFPKILTFMTLFYYFKNL